MEIKKYVLLENKKIINTKTIQSDWSSGFYGDFTIKNDDFYQHASKKIKSFQLKGHGEGGFIDFTPIEKKLGKILKTSDNILDLVEVGDLVSFRSVSGVYYVIGIDDENIYVFDNAIEKEEVKNIYKLQPNGDYKKYKVEE